MNKTMQRQQKVVLLIHQSSSLYGSDKTLLSLALAIKTDSLFKPLVVVPSQGPLVDKLTENDIQVLILPVLKVSRSLLSPKNLWKLPLTMSKEIRQFKNNLKDHEISIVHSNTLAVLMGMFVYKDFKAKHVWHVHEIIEKPALVRKFYSFILPKVSDQILMPSDAVKRFWLNQRTELNNKFNTVLNGVDVPEFVDDSKISLLREKTFQVPSDAIIIGLVGRINRHKGHDVLLKAFEELYADYPNIYLVMIGSPPPGQEFMQTDLEEKIEKSPSSDRCRLIGFHENISELWASIDIAVVPTTNPEPFGLVALEAMLAKKPVVASADGGLIEIVVDNETGFLFETRNVYALKDKIETLINNKQLRISMGEKGYKRATSQFSVKRHTDQIIEIYKNLMTTQV